jgi:phosphoribosyl-AMP cyclohydrolase
MSEEINWDSNGLVPAIVQDDKTKQVLMLAYMNAESLATTLETGNATFWSRRRKSLWVKGETSGHFLRVREIKYDCDADAILVLADPAGPTCHTGEVSCFYRNLK